MNTKIYKSFLIRVTGTDDNVVRNEAKKIIKFIDDKVKLATSRKTTAISRKTKERKIDIEIYACVKDEYVDTFQDLVLDNFNCSCDVYQDWFY